MDQRQKMFPESFAAELAKNPGRPYRPSNGTEGMMFEERWCSQCVKDSETKPCDILGRAMAFGIADSEYPPEWRINEEGQPECTAFSTETPEERGAARKPLPGQLSMAFDSAGDGVVTQ